MTKRKMSWTERNRWHKKYPTGIMLVKGKLLHSYYRGGLLRLPWWIKRTIAYAWNRLACRRLGHSYLIQDGPDCPVVCCDCGKIVKSYDSGEVIQGW